MYIMRRIDSRENVNAVGSAIRAYNLVQSGKRIKVEWGIGGLKMKWRVLQGCFRRRRKLFGVIFRTCCILTNFLHRRRKDMSIIIDGDANGGAWGDDPGNDSDPDEGVEDVAEDDFNPSGDDG